jgi:hypothetical protein
MERKDTPDRLETDILIQKVATKCTRILAITSIILSKTLLPFWVPLPPKILRFLAPLARRLSVAEDNVSRADGQRVTVFLLVPNSMQTMLNMLTRKGGKGIAVQELCAFMLSAALSALL